jgi:hypothetical protein
MLMGLRPAAWAFLLVLYAAVGCGAWEARPYALVNPVPSTSHLQVAQEGLQLLESIDTPVAPIVVIGPYRSGKSFLLNQLLGVSCSEWLRPDMGASDKAAIQVSSSLHARTQLAKLRTLWPATYAECGRGQCSSIS